MFEDRTKDIIHNEMLNEISNDYDKSIGSFIYDATKPAAIKFEKAYQDLDEVMEKMDIENLEGEELTQRIYERTGIERKPATKATTTVFITGNVGAVVNIGDKVASDTVNFTITESKTIDSTGQVSVLVECDEYGSIGNVPANAINRFPVTLTGLISVTNPNPVTNGYDEESDADLLERYYQRIRTPVTGANKSQFKNWALEVTGVGDAKVIPLWNGDNTVKIVIIDSNKLPASAELVAEVQEYIDPGSSGTGEGVGPACAYVTVESAEGVTIDISFTAIKDPTYTDEQILANVQTSIIEYFKTIAFKSKIVSYAKIGNAIFDSAGIIDYTSLTVNGGTNNITLTDLQVPVLGVVTIA